jgi:hypothetical protein
VPRRSPADFLDYGAIGENIEKMRADPTEVRRQVLHTELGSYELAGYGRFGVTLRALEEEITFFVPWGG